MLIAGVLCGISIHWEPALSRDASGYVMSLELFFRGHSIEEILAMNQTCLTPTPLILFSGPMYAGISAEVAGRLINITAFLLLIPIFYTISILLYPNRFFALIATALLSTHPRMITLACQVQRDMLYLFFCGAALLCLAASLRVRKRHSQLIYWSIAGVVIGLGMLTRYECYEFSIIFPIVLIAQIVLKKLPLKYGISSFILFIFGIILVHLLMIEWVAYAEIHGAYFQKYLRWWNNLHHLS